MLFTDHFNTLEANSRTGLNELLHGDVILLHIAGITPLAYRLFDASLERLSTPKRHG